MGTQMPNSFKKRICFLYSNSIDQNPQANLIIKGLRDHGHKVSAISDEFIQLLSVCNLDTVYSKIKICLLLWWAVWLSWIYRPNVIIIEDLHFFIPCLKVFTKAKIIQLRYFMVDDIKKKVTRQQPTKFEKICVGLTDDVIVPSKMAAQLIKNKYELCKTPRVIYPCMDIPVAHYEIVDPKLRAFFRKDAIYVYITDMGPSSELFKIVNSLCTICDAYKEREREPPNLLIIIKKCDLTISSIKNQIEVTNSFISMKDRRFGLASKVYIHFENDETAIHALIQKCDGLICSTPDEIYNEYFMLAIKYGIPIIGRRSGFAAEVIQDGYTGIFVENTAGKYASAMSCLYVLPTAKKYTVVMQLLEYRCNYNFRRFAINYNACVIENTEEVRVATFEDLLSRVHWCSVMYTLRFEMLCGYITSLGILPGLYRYNKPDKVFRSRRFFMNGGFRIGKTTFYEIIANVRVRDLRTLNLQLGWKEVRYHVLNKGDKQKPEDVVIDYYLEDVIQYMNINGNINGRLYAMTEDIKYCIGKCACLLP